MFDVRWMTSLKRASPMDFKGREREEKSLMGVGGKYTVHRDEVALLLTCNTSFIPLTADMFLSHREKKKRNTTEEHTPFHF